MKRMAFAIMVDLGEVLYGGYCTVSTFKLAQHDDTYPTALVYASLGLPVASAAVLATEAFAVLHDILPAGRRRHSD